MNVYWSGYQDKSVSGETPQAQQGGKTARGKRVPGAEINGQTVKAIRKLAQSLSQFNFIAFLQITFHKGHYSHAQTQMHADGLHHRYIHIEASDFYSGRVLLILAQRN